MNDLENITTEQAEQAEQAAPETQHTTKTVYLTRKDPTVNCIIQATFPEYTGQRVEATITPTVYFYGTMWDEGYKRDYVMVKLDTIQAQPIPQEPFHQHSQAHHQPWTIPNGFVVVVHVYGRVEHIEIITPTDNITKALEQKIVLTDDETTVLSAIAGFKSFYQGIPNFRFHQARQATGITAERYETAKTSLIGKRLLNRAGAITVDGRNAIGSKRL